MSKLIVTVGLPRSGKSTWAKEQGLPIVNRDSIRLALHGERYLQAAEDMITVIEDTMIKALFLAGNDTIIIDATHTTERRLGRWFNINYKNSVDLIDVVVIPTTKDECIARAKNENDMVIIPIIEKFHGACDIEVLTDQWSYDVNNIITLSYKKGQKDDYPLWLNFEKVIGKSNG